MSELYELPNGWEWKKIDDVTTELSSKNQALQCHNKPYLSLENIESFTGNIINYQTVKESNIIGTCSNFNSNSVIYSKLRPYLNKVATPNFDGVGTTELIVFLPKENLDKQYLAHFLRSGSVVAKIDASSYGAKMPRASSKFLRALDFPLPPLKEQQRLVKKIDLLFKKIDKSIELHQKNMDEANAFMGSVLNEVFGELEERYPQKIINDGIKTILTGTTPPTKESKYYEDATIHWYGPSDFGKSKILMTSKTLINSVSLTDKKAKVYEKDSLLLVAIGSTVGKIGVIKYEASSNQQITAMKFKNDVDVNFAYYWFYYIKQIVINTASAATLPIINQKAIKELKFIIPPLPIQQKVVEYLDTVSEKMDKVKSIQKEKMESLKALKASILDKAFRGEL